MNILQVSHLSPEGNAERIADAEPCHNYKGLGSGPAGCW